ncbi:GNAT family N-acetyltransferase [Nocardioides acrostichi]|uniref:GNAT family N-acetyltransferase n=1 Tax=Nocardioides acrostichi TaxID=2784339 RepID=A0A930YAD7_9ACTN|nr:GNAT family N-acetyltransferase [Nocardioides acrostichi]MBF4161303.1 GNAT family N-acetyltransferase [Nocardioides acrostichi]
MGELLLRPLRVDDEDAALEADRLLAADDFTFVLGRDEGEAWADYVHRTHGWPDRVGLPEGHVAGAFLAAEVDGTLVGRASLRFELNDFLGRWGGHVGYGVHPAHRRLGYATAILRAALPLLAERSVEQALVTCDLDNEGSRRTIERCGGVPDGIAEPDPDAGGPASTAKLRFWVPTGGPGGLSGPR